MSMATASSIEGPSPGLSPAVTAHVADLHRENAVLKRTLSLKSDAARTLASHLDELSERLQDSEQSGRTAQSHARALAVRYAEAERLWAMERSTLEREIESLQDRLSRMRAMSPAKGRVLGQGVGPRDAAAAAARRRSQSAGPPMPPHADTPDPARQTTQEAMARLITNQRQLERKIEELNLALRLNQASQQAAEQHAREKSLENDHLRRDVQELQAVVAELRDQTEGYRLLLEERTLRGEWQVDEWVSSQLSATAFGPGSRTASRNVSPAAASLSPRRRSGVWRRQTSNGRRTIGPLSSELERAEGSVAPAEADAIAEETASAIEELNAEVAQATSTPAAEAGDENAESDVDGDFDAAADRADRDKDAEIAALTSELKALQLYISTILTRIMESSPVDSYRQVTARDAAWRQGATVGATTSAATSAAVPVPIAPLRSTSRGSAGAAASSFPRYSGPLGQRQLLLASGTSPTTSVTAMAARSAANGLYRATDDPAAPLRPTPPPHSYSRSPASSSSPGTTTGLESALRIAAWFTGRRWSATSDSFDGHRRSRSVGDGLYYGLGSRGAWDDEVDLMVSDSGAASRRTSAAVVPPVPPVPQRLLSLSSGYAENARFQQTASPTPMDPSDPDRHDGDPVAVARTASATAAAVPARTSFLSSVFRTGSGSGSSSSARPSSWTTVAASSPSAAGGLTPDEDAVQERALAAAISAAATAGDRPRGRARWRRPHQSAWYPDDPASGSETDDAAADVLAYRRSRAAELATSPSSHAGAGGAGGSSAAVQHYITDSFSSQFLDSDPFAAQVFSGTLADVGMPDEVESVAIHHHHGLGGGGGSDSDGEVDVDFDMDPDMGMGMAMVRRARRGSSGSAGSAMTTTSEVALDAAPRIPRPGRDAAAGTTPHREPLFWRLFGSGRQ
ncbi:hypothetical protein H9P43_000561 [Blastocladiella emersonii ATCC 22665]|nr:hypothetical protein H9P43_000561 [Blastocladiella emersonii ATCC 22665]